MICLMFTKTKIIRCSPLCLSRHLSQEIPHLIWMGALEGRGRTECWLESRGLLYISLFFFCQIFTPFHVLSLPPMWKHMNQSPNYVFCDVSFYTVVNIVPIKIFNQKLKCYFRVLNPTCKLHLVKYFSCFSSKISSWSPNI